MLSIIAIVMGWVYWIIVEYSIHRWAFHKKHLQYDSIFSFHLYEHHIIATKEAMDDHQYQSRSSSRSARRKENILLFIIAAVNAPFVFLSPLFYLSFICSEISYFVIHKKSHTNSEWSRRYLSHHYDHHMGPDSYCNFGVQTDIIDRILGTRKKFYGTKQEAVSRHYSILRYSRHRLKTILKNKHK
jgi:sterol desaturase/sphingolipid hydroxylase (fatty acid hydroxylase superfamily)